MGPKAFNQFINSFFLQSVYQKSFFGPAVSIRFASQFNFRQREKLFCVRERFPFVDRENMSFFVLARFFKRQRSAQRSQNLQKSINASFYLHIRLPSLDLSAKPL